MTVVTRLQKKSNTNKNKQNILTINQELLIESHNILRDEVNIAVIKGLRSITKRVCYVAKIPISKSLFEFLSNKYKIRYRYSCCSEFLDDYRILRAYFKSKTNVSKIEDGSFKLGLRRGHKVYYKTYRNGKEIKHSIESQPYLAINFFRNDRVITYDKSTNNSSTLETYERTLFFGVNDDTLF